MLFRSLLENEQSQQARKAELEALLREKVLEKLKGILPQESIKDFFELSPQQHVEVIKRAVELLQNQSSKEDLTATLTDLIRSLKKFNELSPESLVESDNSTDPLEAEIAREFKPIDTGESEKMSMSDEPEKPSVQ